MSEQAMSAEEFARHLSQVYSWSLDRGMSVSAREQEFVTIIKSRDAALTSKGCGEAYATQGVPEGWALVPLEPTPEMLRAGYISMQELVKTATPEHRNKMKWIKREKSGGWCIPQHEKYITRWKDMIDAAPKAPTNGATRAAPSDAWQPLNNGWQPNIDWGKISVGDKILFRNLTIDEITFVSQRGFAETFSADIITKYQPCRTYSQDGTGWHANYYGDYEIIGHMTAPNQSGGQDA